MEKNEIRKRILSARDALSDQDCMEMSTSILKKLLKTDAFLRAWKVGLYASVKNEVITYPLIGKSAMLDKGVAFPKITDPVQKQMVFRYVLGMNDLKTGTFGILEPQDNTTVMEQPDVIILPVVAFDSMLNRIGQGGGYYDVYLKAHPKAYKIGLAYEFQKTESIPRKGWDVPLDLIITEEQIYE